MSRSEGDPLQLWAWGDAHEGTGEEPERWLVEDMDAPEIRAVAQLLVRPARLGKNLFYAPHGPIWKREDEDAVYLLAGFLEDLAMYAKHGNGVALKFDPRASMGTASSPADQIASALTAYDRLSVRTARFDLQAPTTRIVDLLDGGDELMASWHADARRLSKRAEREGVQVEIDRTGSADAIGEFHAILEATAQRGDFRARSRTFLERAANAFAGSTGWYTVLARHGGRAIAGMALPRAGDRAYYLYGASLKEPELKHKYGAYAAMAAAMKALAADGVGTLDMWGVVEPDDPTADPAWEGFSAFKRTFGGRPVRHPGTFDLVLDPFWYRLRDLREAARARLRR
jgi:lipid II:glycine glycyltransferase (peptidoglycan interpeptide bridge formation enzyme)